MAVFVVHCKGESWQDDFEPVAVRLYRLFARTLRGWRDREDATQEAVCRAMERFARVWAKGKVLKVFSWEHELKARIGWHFVRKTETGGTTGVRSVRAGALVSDPTASADHAFSVYRDGDMIADAGQLSERHARAALYVVRGYSVLGVRNVLGGKHRTVKRLLLDIVDWIS